MKPEMPLFDLKASLIGNKNMKEFEISFSQYYNQNENMYFMIQWIRFVLFDGDQAALLTA